MDGPIHDIRSKYKPIKSPERIKVFIDYRESNEDLLRAIELHPFFISQFDHMKTGDFRIGDQLLVERKTCSDFALSVVQGRLFRQASRLCREVHDRNVDSAVLIVEGPEDELRRINISREAILGAMASIQVSFHLPVLRTQTPIETVKMMEILYYQMTQDDEISGRSYPQRWGKFNRKSRKKNQIFILQGLPGVGASRAADLLAHFGSVRAVFTANENELCNVKGVGRATAENIRKILDP